MKLSGLHCLVTAGPTYEAIDPVRFIGNRSSGKMGIEIAKELTLRGAFVTLILGPTSESTEGLDIYKITHVESSDAMYKEVMNVFDKMKLGIFSAAVADYKPKEISKEKIKKQGENFTIELVKTKDILKEAGALKTQQQILVGFALETNNEIQHAKTKIQTKNLDMIVLNSLNDKGAGFKFDTNKITIIDRHNNITSFELKSKRDVAIDILNYIESYF